VWKRTKFSRRHTTPLPIYCAGEVIEHTTRSLSILGAVDDQLSSAVALALTPAIAVALLNYSPTCPPVVVLRSRGTYCFKQQQNLAVG
jgi:hypothetical protein